MNNCSHFEILANAWAQTSSLPLRARYASQYMQQILLLGEVAIPLIIDRMRKMPDEWHTALKVLSGHIPNLTTQSVTDICQYWIEWWESRHAR